MKQILFSLFIGLASAAWAQAPQPAGKEPAKPAAQETAKPAAPTKEAAKPAPAKEAAKPAGEVAKQAAVTPRKPRRWNEDARHCLERGTTTEIIKCAEEYL
jgi:hypothetical protein